ncbi:hypothetical protein EVAR_102415_1 [Eumeta japonica]|uniref:Uncharacterized protein n=1 Tax=Eumeta variegata TaxID=151549 RepID=A0A4C1Z1K8_EUMVA|nr:hypothetical protein EVAR_102415_1 [Eumeta japonica]
MARGAARASRMTERREPTVAARGEVRHWPAPRAAWPAPPRTARPALPTPRAPPSSERFSGVLRAAARASEALALPNPVGGRSGRRPGHRLVLHPTVR